MSVLGVLLIIAWASAAHPASKPSPPEQKRRVGNWYYIFGTDRMFRVPRFVGAVHDTQARTSLIFTCQGRPGVKPGKGAVPMLTMSLTDPIGAPGRTTRVRMRLDQTPPFAMRWVTNAEGESTLAADERPDPLQLLYRMARNKNRVLRLETQSHNLAFQLDGARTVLSQMLDKCVKPVTGADKRARPRRRE